MILTTSGFRRVGTIHLVIQLQSPEEAAIDFTVDGSTTELPPNIQL
jgi:hypothetical protein